MIASSYNQKYLDREIQNRENGLLYEVQVSTIYSPHI